MAGSFLAEMERFAASLIEAQQALLDILRRKRKALASSDLAALEALEPPESAAAQKLQTLVAWRARILDAARRAGKTFETLSDLVQSLPDPRKNEAIAALATARALAAELQQESWIHWVITNRCCNFYGEVLELIAHGGKKAPTYQSSDTDWVQRGGAVLNASA
jgi:hypothetical protein